AGGEIDYCRGDKEGRYLARPALEQLCVLPLDYAETADAGADIGANPRGDLWGDFQSRVVHRLLSGSDSIMYEDVHLFNLFFSDELLRFEILYFTCKFDRILGGVKVGNDIDAAASGD